MYIVLPPNMDNNILGVKNGQKFNKTHNFEVIEIDFGIRTISNQNSSKIIALPKTALANFGDGKTKKVNVKLVQQGTYTFIKLTPIFEK